MSLELALNNHSAALNAFADALKNSTMSMASIGSIAAPAPEAAKEEPKVETKPEVKAEKPVKEKAVKAEKKVETKPDHPTLEEIVAVYTPFLAKTHESIDANKAFAKTVLTKLGAAKVSEIKDTDRKQAIEWVNARIEDADFEIDADEEGMV